MSYFPPGPSNIQYLYLNVEFDYYETEEHKKAAYEIYSKNLHTHKNIKTLILNEGNPSAYNVVDLKLDQMQLEELVLENSDYDDIVTILTSLPQTIKRIKFNLWLSDVSEIEKVVSVLRPLTCFDIEEIEIKITTQRGLGDLYDYIPDLIQIKDRLKDEFKDTSTLKKFVFLNYKRCLVLDVLDKDVLVSK
jgi:hypothetical protein